MAKIMAKNDLMLAGRRAKIEIYDVKFLDSSLFYTNDLGIQLQRRAFFKVKELILPLPEGIFEISFQI